MPEGRILQEECGPPFSLAHYIYKKPLAGAAPDAVHGEPMTRTAYTAEPISPSDSIEDIRIRINGKIWHLWGRNGCDREAALADSITDADLPVLIGSGLGHCLKLLADKGIPTAVVDRETAILHLTDACTGQPDTVLWLDDAAPRQVMDRLTQWQREHGHRRLVPLVMPLYPRLDREYYGALAETLKAGNQTDFWSQARYPKFQSTTPRVLFFDSDYFLCNEIHAGLKRLGVEYRTIELGDRETGSTEFIESILKNVVDFRPDFALTVNHFGLDRDGKLAGLLDDLKLPLASWFVDNPHLIIYDYDHPGTDNTIIFTFDAGNLDEMRAKGFNHVHYLPLATDPHRFRPGQQVNAPAEWHCDVSFVGNSMTDPVSRSLELTHLPEKLKNDYESVAGQFGASGETAVARYLKDNHPDWSSALESLPTTENRLALESLLTWEATRQYRLACVQSILKFSPLIVGDDGWKPLLGPTGWRHMPRLDYYGDLPRFYPLSKINFNCTSRQMIGAVNQRVFDIPACGGFVLTDHREQMEDLFDIGSEAIVYRNPEDIPALIRELLADPKRRENISAKARKRILADHTYEIRLQRLMKIMRDTCA